MTNKIVHSSLAFPALTLSACVDEASEDIHTVEHESAQFRHTLVARTRATHS
jgi:hypothetical protein